MKYNYIIVSGRVQGVCYRYFTQRYAEKYNILGFVRNMPDGNVEIVAAGSEKNMTEFINKLREGPSCSRVIDLQISEITLTEEYKYFQIKF